MPPVSAILSLSNAEQPVLLIVAGPNGSGKSSVYRDADLEMDGRSVWIVNPDVLAARICRQEGFDLLAANIASVTRIEAWLNGSIAVHKTVGVETVLSTDKYRKLLIPAKQMGFAVWMIYVVLDSPDRNVERVRLRVIKGGHAVPEDRIRDRFTRSLLQLPWFLEQSDRAWVYDNSAAKADLIARKQDDVIEVFDGCLAHVAAAIATIQTE